MPGESFGGWGEPVMSYDDEVWKRIMDEAKDQMGKLGEQSETVTEAETSEVAAEAPVSEALDSGVAPEAVEVEISSQGDDVAQAERHRADLDAKLAAENEGLMQQSEEEMAAFERKLEMSPEAYWQELKNEYALQGVNLGLMPDVRGMREDAAGFMTEKVGEGDQSARVNMAIKTELDKMARSKAEEIQKWQSEGRGLPITFESEWIESGRRDAKNVLNEYYGAEGEFGKQAKDGGELTDEEKVAWQMASLPQKPGTLNPVLVVKEYAGRFEGESVPEYYNRLKNYRKQDQMREWQLRQDQGKQVIDRGEEPMGEAETEAVETEEEKKAREVAEAIQETDEEIARLQAEREAKKRAEMVQEVVKSPSFRMAVKHLIERFLDMMKLEDTTEEDEAYYAEMERQEQEKQKTQKGFDAELWAATDTSGLPPVFEGVEVETGTEASEEEEGAKEVTDDIEGVVANLTPERVQEVIKTRKQAEKMLRRSDLSAAARASIETNYDRLTAILGRYQEIEREKEQERGAAGELALDYLARKGLISENAGAESAKELMDLKTATEAAMLDAAWRNDNLEINEYRERIQAIKRAMEWLGIEPTRREIDVIPVGRTQGEATDGANAAETAGAVA